jgi:uncharacterized protein
MSPGGVGPVRARLADGRWHYQHGPIDVLLEAEGECLACARSLEASWERFQQLLPQLVVELGELRRPAHEHLAVQGAVAQRMMSACAPFAAARFITPMAAVAGAVADELIQSFRRMGVRRAYINNGGDIALHLTPGEQYRVGICANLERGGSSGICERPLDSVFVIDAAMPIRGVATSGWRGRSFSLGIADSVTVVASCAAAADVAATLIANAVDCAFPGIIRAPADQLKDDTDLGSRLVTLEVPALPSSAIAAALASGRIEAEYWRERGLITAAALFLQGSVELVLPPAALRFEPAAGATREQVLA